MKRTTQNRTQKRKKKWKIQGDRREKTWVVCVFLSPYLLLLPLGLNFILLIIMPETSMIINLLQNLRSYCWWVHFVALNPSSLSQKKKKKSMDATANIMCQEDPVNPVVSTCLQVCGILVVSHLFHLIFKPLGQPGPVAQVLVCTLPTS